MSTTGEDLKELIRSVKQAAGSKKNTTTSSRRKWDLVTIILVPVCIGAVGGIAGFLLSGRGLMLLVPAVGLSALSAFLLMLCWKKMGMGYGESDVLVGVLKTKTVEMERDRFVRELEEAYKLLQASTDKQRLFQDELARERTGRDEIIVEREQKNKLDFESEKARFIALLKGEEQKRIDLEKEIAEQEIAWARKFEEFETHLRKGTLKDLEAQYDKSRSEIAQEHYANIESLKREGEEKQKNLEESFKAEMIIRDRKIEELNRRIAERQNVADVKAISGVSRLTEQMDKMRKIYEAEKESLAGKLQAQEIQFHARLVENDEQLRTQKIQIISACEAFVTELESREKELEKKEKQFAEREGGH
ncbi:MAG TPA: hypothetical protein DCL44_12095 [Elusimicrobia bacterium]|nr:hypothetical protein [Elusimicrobiota bacterium]